ncbi:MAG: hypothetical protein LBD73_02400 [Deferribacteraceae bacterium]|jgi:hypothetical protein|nr:hypothetical protein [Deferribacteraceae bacterium]
MPNNQIQFDAVAGIITRRIEEEPASKNILYSILKFCIECRTIEDVAAYFEKITQNSATLHSCGTYVSWLLKLNAIERTDSLFKTTPEGTVIVNELSYANRLKALFEKRPEFRNYFIKILQACVEPKSKDDLEEMFDDVYKATGLYLSYFTAELEDAGGLVWMGKWKTTDDGTALITAVSPNEDIKGEMYEN